MLWHRKFNKREREKFWQTLKLGQNKSSHKKQLKNFFLQLTYTCNQRENIHNILKEKS